MQQMSNVDSVVLFGVIVFWTVASFLAGCWWYRRTLKKDPVKLEKFAKEINSLPESTKQVFEQAGVDIRTAAEKAEARAREAVHNFRNEGK